MILKGLKISKLLPIIAVLLMSFTTINVLAPQKTQAVSASGWKPGRIIDDAVFFNNSAMSVGQIQDFLNAKVPNCDRWNPTTFSYAGKPYGPPYTCLKEYQENPNTHENNIGRFNANGTPYNVPGGQSAAQIIWDAAQAYTINPQSLIVLLQKETAIVTDPWSAGWQYDRAMGYGCPDSGPGGTANCNTNYYGFYNQVGNAAWQLRRYVTYPDQYNFKAGVTRNILWQVGNVCGSAPVYLENSATAALYNYTPYQPNQAALNNLYGTGDSCSAYGNRNFWRLFNDWFGGSIMPRAFQSTNGGPIYYYMNGYRVAVTQMAVLQDYGVSPEAIQKVSDEVVNSTKDPSVDNISPYLGNLIKSPSDADADGGSIYLISVGKKYQIQSMDQFNNFGFNQADIKYYPLDFINSINNGGYLNNFVSSPLSNVFKIENSKKRLIFTYQDFQYFNPSLSATPLSYYMINQISGGVPLVNGPALVKEATGDTVKLLSDDIYYSIPDYDIYSCWGFDATLKIPAYRVTQNGYIASPNITNNLDCTYQKEGQIYLLNKYSKIIVPDTVGLANVTANASLNYLINKLPTRADQLKKYIKKENENAVWYIDGSQKKLIPTYKSFIYLGLNQSSYDTIYGNLLDKITSNGIKLADGQLVKTSNSSSVFGIFNDKRIAYPTSDLFLSYGNQWADIATFDSTTLDNSYPILPNTIVSSYFFDQSNNKLYLFGNNACKLMNDNNIVAYGINKSTVANNQLINKSLYPGMNIYTCADATNYAKGQNSSLVYFMESGKKRPITTYSSLLAHNGGKEPTITIVSTDILNTITTGDNL